MCGRFVVSYTYDELVAMLDSDFHNLIAGEVPNLPNYNVAPTTNIPVLIKKDSKTLFQSIKWGYQPFSSFNNSIINIRSETMNQKQIYKENVTKHRCIIVASGFYEWKRTAHQKQPFYIKPKKDKLMFFAGIYANDISQENENTCAIITMDANDKIRSLHDRMPVILSKNEVDAWLDHAVYLGKTIKDKDIIMHPVSLKVNSIRNNDASNIDKVEEAPTLFTI